MKVKQKISKYKEIAFILSLLILVKVLNSLFGLYIYISGVSQKSLYLISLILILLLIIREFFQRRIAMFYVFVKPMSLAMISELMFIIE